MALVLTGTPLHMIMTVPLPRGTYTVRRHIWQKILLLLQTIVLG